MQAQWYLSMQMLQLPRYTREEKVQSNAKHSSSSSFPTSSHHYSRTSRPQDLVPGSTTRSLPKVSLSLSRIPRIPSLRSAILSLTMVSLRKTCKQHHERTKEQANHSRKRSPHSDRVIGVTSTPILVNVILDDAKQRKITCHDHESDEPCNSRDHGGEDGAAETSAEREEEGDECQAAGDGVEDHNAGQGFGGIG